MQGLRFRCAADPPFPWLAADQALKTPNPKALRGWKLLRISECTNGIAVITGNVKIIPSKARESEAPELQTPTVYVGLRA